MMRWFWQKTKSNNFHDQYQFGECPRDCPNLLGSKSRLRIEQQVYGCEWKKGVSLPAWCKRFQKNLLTRSPDGKCWAPRECEDSTKEQS